jgi:hypothetical protein
MVNLGLFSSFLYNNISLTMTTICRCCRYANHGRIHCGTQIHKSIKQKKIINIVMRIQYECTE